MTTKPFGSPQQVADALEGVKQHIEKLDNPPVLDQLHQALRRKVGESENEEQITEYLIEADYVSVDSNEVVNINLTEFMTDHGIKREYTPLEEFERQEELASDFAEHLVEERDICLVKDSADHHPDKSSVYQYNIDNRTWEPDEGRIVDLTEKFLPHYNNSAFESKVRRSIWPKHGLLFEELGVGEDKIAISNGILELKKNNRRTIEKDDYVLNKLPVQLRGGIEGEYPEIWDEFLSQSTNSESDRKKLQEFAGYCLMPWTAKHEKILLLLGPTDTGKSVFLETIRAMLGAENAAKERLKDLADTRWAVANVKDKIANIHNDLDAQGIDDTGQIKLLASGEPMMAEHKQVPKFEVKPTAKHLFAANKSPSANDRDSAFLNRFLTVIFNNTVPPEEQDKDLLEKLTEQEVLNGVFRWALEGYRRLQQQGEFTSELSPLATTELWQEFGKGPERFVSKNFEFKSQASDNRQEEETWRVKTEDAYDYYVRWVRKKGIYEEHTRSKFSSIIYDMAGIKRSRQDGVAAFGGVRWKEGVKQSFDTSQEEGSGG